MKDRADVAPAGAGGAALLDSFVYKPGGELDGIDANNIVASGRCARGP